MKKYLQRTLQVTPKIWMMLISEIIITSLLYTCLIVIIGIPKSTSFFITLACTVILAIVGLLRIPRHLLLLMNEDDISLSRFPGSIVVSKIYQEKQINHVQRSKTATQTKPLEIFLAYAHQDRELLERLQIHLKPLQQHALIDAWSDMSIKPGMNWKEEIDKHIGKSQIILLLVSPDFLASDTFYNVEVRPALERYKRGEAKVIPIILRSVAWNETALHDLKPLPTNGEPVISSSWRSIDDALSSVAKSIQKVVNEILSQDVKEPWQGKSESVL